MKILFDFIGQMKPKIYTKLKELIAQMDGSHMVVLSFAFQWFVCLFCNSSINKEITKVIWDFLLVDGCKVLFKAALVMIGMIENEILSSKTFEEYIKNVEKAVPKVTDTTKFKEEMLKIYLSHEILRLLRMNLRRVLKNEGQSLTSSSKKKKGVNNGTYRYKKRCRKSWNACMQTL